VDLSLSWAGLGGVAALPLRPALSSHVLARDELEALRARPLLVLSPHFDDACFSLGGFLLSVRSGELVNVFTQGDHLARRWSARDQQEVYAIRDAEDAAFAKACCLSRSDLGCEEPSLRGRRPGGLDGLADDIDQIRAAVLAHLDKRARGFAPGEKGVLLAPLGAGRHVNHRAVAEVVAAAMPRLVQAWQVYFYEDLPYASSWFGRRAALSRMRRRVLLKRRFALLPGWKIKKRLLALYPSQLEGEPRQFRFRPWARPLAAHEAFWEAAPRERFQEKCAAAPYAVAGERRPQPRQKENASEGTS
jgi:LmbE family N-acetylglucosaminyl deacetylase